MITEKELSIYIADDHLMVVDGLREILKAKNNWIIKGVASDGEQLLELVKKERVDVAILDINMPKVNGIQCTRWIKDNQPSTKVIILTMYPEKTFANQLLKAGADGCLLKAEAAKT
ncbi:MAG: response regulator transcription factor [Cytophagales bacterium]|nr:response regulator transcription factor [Cytophagales bacterium]